MTDNELLKRQAREKARMDMVDGEPHNPYPVNSIQYWDYANEVNKAFTEELGRAV